MGLSKLSPRPGCLENDLARVASVSQGACAGTDGGETEQPSEWNMFPALSRDLSIRQQPVAGAGAWRGGTCPKRKVYGEEAGARKLFAKAEDVSGKVTFPEGAGPGPY